jgi:hypothetical protein
VKAGAVAAALRAFAAERAPVGVVGALAAALSAGPWALVRGDGAAFLRGAVVTGLVLFILRAVDDLRSVAHDRLAHPGRGLPSGRIPRRPLAAGAALLGVTAALAGGPVLAAGLAALAAWYAAYFALVARVPPVARPPLVNAVFLGIPLGVAALAEARVGPATGLAGDPGLVALALFYWLSATGHDFAHEVHAADEAPAGPPTTPSASIGGRTAAILGFGCYAAAFAGGLAAARAAPSRGVTPHLFTGALVVLSAYLGLRLVRLVVHPCRERARRLYVAGVACFALPSLLLAADRLLGW